ncbi:cation:proton antiporter [Nocardiopsis sp. LDBS1602]|uniref:cation:proton antiporter n=1 Tax=Nocardiopsis sp. LDBS1602 TaxID=3109597 RepID=UPI002DBE43D7|nr:cation:proton antiporter [Nocardiopsis sp. LDBS1602]MEC3894388.1 cation:proton antiporter [Nocardiopsis sp. LDBS1602]
MRGKRGAMGIEWAATIMVAAVLAVTLLARRLRIADPILLIVLGVVLAIIPSLPTVIVEPDLLLLLVLPPLLFWHAFIVSPREIKATAPAVTLLAIFLVALTALTVGCVLKLLLDLPWPVAIAIGAVLAPTDPIAFLTVARRLGVSPRLVGLLDGENLLNDFTALVIYGVAVEAALTDTWSAPHALSRFVLTAFAGAAIGLVVGFMISTVNRRITTPSLPPIVTLAGAYLAFLPAEALHVSAVLAAGVAGRTAGARSPIVDRPEGRIVGYGFWNTWTFLLTAVLFVLVGLQLPVALVGLTDIAMTAMICLAVIGTVVTLRLVFSLGIGLVPAPIARRMTVTRRRWPWAESLIVGWSGMRGAFSLVMALILPLDFPYRDLAIVITFSVILATLIGQGLTLPILIRRLPIERDEVSPRERIRARQEAREAALDRLDEISEEGGISEEQEARLRSGYRNHGGEDAARAHRAELEMIAAERRAAIDMRRNGRISDDILREIESDLDMRAVLLHEHLTDPGRG